MLAGFRSTDPTLVGTAPFKYIPVEFVPSPELLKRSNFTLTLLASLADPRPPPPVPTTEAPTPWMVKVKPSAEAFSSWKLNCVVNLVMSKRLVVNALADWLAPPSVSCKFEPLILADRFNV